MVSNGQQLKEHLITIAPEIPAIDVCQKNIHAYIQKEGATQTNHENSERKQTKRKTFNFLNIYGT